MLDVKHIVEQIGDAESLNGWRLGAIGLLMWWSKLLGKMLLMWWEEVKIASWRRQLGIETPKKEKQTGKKVRAVAKE